MSPVAAPERPPLNSNSLSDAAVDAEFAAMVDANPEEPTRSGDFDAVLAMHPELADLGEMNETNLGELEQPAGHDEEVEEQLAQLQTNLTPPSTPAAPSSATPPTPPPTPVHPMPTVPGTPDTPHREPANDEPLSIVVVDRSVDAKKMARALAEQRLSEEAHEGGRLKRFTRAMWRNGVAHEWYRQKYIRQAHEEIVHHQDVLHDTGSSESARKQAEDYLFKRFQAGDGYISKRVGDEGGEQLSVLDDNSQLGKDLKKLIQDATHDRTMSADAITAKYNEIIDSYRSGDGNELFGAGEVTSHNIHTIVEKMRGIGLHGESLIHAVQQMRVISGESRSASRTEAHYKGADKAIEWLGKKKWLANSFAPEAIATGVALGYGIILSTRGAALKAAGFALPGVLGAGLGALRGRKIAKDEIAQHESDAEFGRVFSETDKRRKRLEENAMRDRKTALELIKSLQTASTKEALDEGGDDALEAALKALAEARIRQGLYDKGQVVLTWSDETKRDEEAFLLTKARAESAISIQKKLDSLTAEDRTRLNFADNVSVDDVLTRDEYEPLFCEQLLENIHTTDKERRKYVRDRMIGHAAIGFVTSLGLTVGGSVLAEHLFSGGSGGFSQSAMADQYNGVKMSSDYHMVPDREGLQMGNYDIQDSHGNVVVDNLKYDPSTGFSNTPDTPGGESSLDKLHHAGFGMRIDHHAAETTTQQVSISDYINKHPTEFQKLDMRWMDNDTPQFDLNEQGMRLTSNPDGSITLGQVMTEHGSSHGGSEINMTDPSHVAVDMAFKQPDGTFAHHVLDIKQGDQIPDQWKPFFQEKSDGTWVFNGGEDSYASLGKLDGDKFYSAAAIPNGGGAVPTVTDTIETSPAHVTTELKGPNHNSGLAIGVVGTLGTKGLSKAERVPPPPEYRPTYGGYETATEEWRQQMITDRIPELRRDPNARISLREGLQWHHDLTRRKDPEYADYIKGLVGTMPNLASLDANTDTIVPILVGANFEYDNIYRTLSLYAEMPDDWKAKTQLVLHVNWIDSKENDPIEKAKIDKTRSEVLRAIRDFPGLNISQFESIWSQEKLDRGEYGDRLIAHAAQQLVDVSMVAAYQGVQDGRIPEDHDILLWKGDADARGMSRFAGPRMTKEFKDHPEADAFSGGVRWGTETYKELPGLGFVLNFMEVYRIAAQRTHIKGFQSTFGVNGGARMSTFAGIGGIGHYTNQKQSPPDDGWGDRMFAARNPNLNGTASVYGASGRQNKRANNDYHRHVGGASIDTDASRFEKVYRNNEPITSIWGNVNSNGYQGRTTGLQAGQNNDDVRNRPDEVIDRIEYQMSDLISHWTAEPAQVATALAIMLPGPGDLGGKLAYYPIQDKEGKLIRDANGKVKFSLTPQGKKWLISRLQFNAKGQYDPYGDRQARQLYGTTVMRGSAGHRWSIPSKQSLSRMIAGRV